MNTSVTYSKDQAQSRTGLRASLWVVQILLAGMFGMAGWMKATVPLAELAQKLPWVTSLPTLTRFIGICELAGAIGLIVPAITRILPKLTPLAASGLVAIMLLAIPFHISRGEIGVLGIPLTLGALAAFVAWGRFRAAPISSRK